MDSVSLAIFFASLSLASCSHNAPVLRMLEERAEYTETATREAQNLDLGESSEGKSDVSTPKVAYIWIFPHKTPEDEQFWGGWISTVVKGGSHRPVNDAPHRQPESPRSSDASPARSQKGEPKK